MSAWVGVAEMKVMQTINNYVVKGHYLARVRSRGNVIMLFYM